MAGGGARVCERVARHRHEPPVVASRAERQLQDSERRPLAYLAVRGAAGEGVEALPTRADDELANAPGRIGDPVRVLRGKTLVVVVVADDDEIGLRCLKRLPELPVRRRAAVRAGAEARMVPV